MSIKRQWSTSNRKGRNKNTVHVSGSFAPNGSSAVSAASNKGEGFTVARTSAGVFTVTFDQVYADLITGYAHLRLATFSAKHAQLGTLDLTAKTLVINVVERLFFDSAEQTGSGAEQTIAHGLGVAPDTVLIAPTEHPGTPDTGAFDIAEGTHTSTNVLATVTTNVKYKVLASGVMTVDVAANANNRINFDLEFAT